MDDSGIPLVCRPRNRFLSSPPRPGQFWRPTSFLPIGFGESFKGGEAASAWSWPRVSVYCWICRTATPFPIDGAVLYLRQETTLLLPYTFSISTSSPRDIPLNKHHCCLPDLSFTATDEALLVFSKQTHPNTLQRFKKRPCLRSVFVNLPHHCDSNSSKRFLCVLSYTHRTPPLPQPMPSCQSLILLPGCSTFRPTEKSTAMLLREGSQVDRVGICHYTH